MSSTSKRILLGLVGLKQSGKDSVADWICSLTPANIPYSRRAFAANLKVEAAEMLGVSTNHLDKIKNIPEIRKLLQRLGREKREVDPEYWIKKMELPENGMVVITDCRYLNEADYIRYRGGFLVRVERRTPGQFGRLEYHDDDTDFHSSEVEQKSIKVDYIIQNHLTLERLKHETKEMLNYFKITNKI